LYAILYYGFPGLNQLHSPFRWVFPLSVSVALLAGYGMEYLAATRSDAQETETQDSAPNMFASDGSQPIWKQPLVLWGSPSLITWSAGAAFWGGVLGLIGLYISRAIYPSLEPIIEPIFVGLAQAPDAFPNTAAFYSYLFPQFQHLALILIMCGCALRVSRCPIYWPKAIGGKPVYIFLIGLVIVLDLFAIGDDFNASVDPALLDFKPELVQWLEQQPDRHLWRVTSFDNKGTKPFNANSAWLTGFNDVRGYDSIIAKQYTDYMKLIEPQNELDFNRIQPLGNIEAINSPLVDLLGIKYIITQEELPLPKLEMVHESDGLRVYENLAVMPRAYSIATSETFEADNKETFADAIQKIDPRFRPIVDLDLSDDRMSYIQFLRGNAPIANEAKPVKATITTETNRRIFVDTVVSEDSWLILNDSYFPGWRAYVRPIGAPESAETEIPIYKINGNFRGVLLNAGEWTVRYQYSPPTLWIGALTTAMGLVIIGFAAVIWAWRRFYRPEGELTNTASIAKNSVAPMTLNLFNRGIDFLFALFYLRWLGPAGSGAYATAIAIAGIYEILSNFGLNAYLIREVSQDRERASEFLLNTTLLRIGTGLVASVPILLYVFTVESNPQTRTAVMFIMVGMVLSGMASGLTGLFYAWEEAEIPAAVQTVTTIMKVGFGVIVLLVGFGFVGLAAVSIIVNAITLLILIFTVRRRYPLNGPWTIDYGLQRRMIIDSYPLMLNHLLATVYWQVDVLILSRMQGEAVVGWYNSSYKYVNALNVIPSFFTFALFPVISRQVKSNIDDARRTFRMAIKLLSLVSLPIAALVTFLAPVMIGILGGDEFLPHGAIALQVVIWSIPFGWLNSVTNYVLISLGQERIMTRAFIIGVGFNLIGNLIVIPYLSYVGAGLTTIASEILLLGLFNYYLVQKMEPVGWLGLIWKLLAITGTMVAAMWLLSPINLWLAVAVGAAIYPAGLYLLGFFGEEERKILGNILPDTISKRFGLS
ncbi:MAG: oligosaccharide flippase family protein, partial [Anaerolineae bacterium]